MQRAIIGILLVGCLITIAGAEVADHPPVTQPGVDPESLYKREGTDPTFQSILDEKRIPIGKNSTEGITGSTIHVNHDILDKCETGKNPIPKNINIHTLGSSLIPRKDFDKWSRWYQEDGNTQVFRLFAGEKNVRNERPLSARIESFSGLHWKKGDWHEWEGTFTIVKPHGCSILQVKNNVNAWSVMINLSDNGEIKLNHRRHQEDKVIATNMTGKPFLLKVRDNGQDYEVFLDGKEVGKGTYDRPDGQTAFRWGMYLGENPVRHDAMIFVTGAKFK